MSTEKPPIAIVELVAPELERKVISIGNRQPFIIVTEEMRVEEEKKAVDVAIAKNLEADLKALDALRGKVANGEIIGLCFVGRHPETGGFITDIPVSLENQPDVDKGLTALLYAGVFDEMRVEMMSIASLRPNLIMNEAGEIEEVESFDSEIANEINGLHEMDEEDGDE